MLISRKNVKICAKCREREFRELLHCAIVEKREIISHRKIFRQINSLAKSLVKPLISRNFCRGKFLQIKLRFQPYKGKKRRHMRLVLHRIHNSHTDVPFVPNAFKM